MRIINIILILLMLLFIAVQYNDPDGLKWMLIYLVPAVWAAIAAFKTRWFAVASTKALLGITIALAAVGTVYYWPKTGQWWSMDVWYNVETAREGMGMMIVTIVLIIVWLTTRRVPATRSD